MLDLWIPENTRPRCSPKGSLEPFPSITLTADLCLGVFNQNKKGPARLDWQWQLLRRKSDDNMVLSLVYMAISV